MDAAEYDNLARTETRHWYYAGKRELVRRWLARMGRPREGGEDVLLDCGAGTGLFAWEMRERARVLVLDDHEESLAMLRRKFSPEAVLALAPGGIPLPEHAVDVVTALDVLEHIARDDLALKEMHRVLKPGGVLVATVPAGMELWSDWDVGLHHHRRYSRETFTALFSPADWDVRHINYTNVIVYPLVWWIRRRAAAKRNQGSRAEDATPWAPLNWLLHRLFVWIGLWRVRFPRGVSLLVVAVRR